MTLFRLLLITIAVLLTAYTMVVIGAHGINFVPYYLRDTLAMGWPGQFNLDFGCLLLLTSLWVAWRHDFSLASLVLPITIAVFGAMALSLYLLITSLQTRGDMAALLLGQRRAAALKN